MEFPHLAALDYRELAALGTTLRQIRADFLKGIAKFRSYKRVFEKLWETIAACGTPMENLDVAALKKNVDAAIADCEYQITCMSRATHDCEKKIIAIEKRLQA